MASGLHRYTIDDVGRIYSDGSFMLPSVSTVLDVRETPERLKNWKKRKKRSGEYESYMSYTQNRGTLIHEACLQSVMPEDDSGDPIKVLWGKEEDNAEAGLKEHNNYDRYKTDEELALQMWEYIRTITGIGPDNDGAEVLDVETFVTNEDIGYAGQFDLLYHDTETDETVLADIKTSKGVFKKHQIQLAAYSMAVALPIDRLEVLRMNPDRQDWDISSSHKWSTPRAELEDEFVRLRDKLDSIKLETIIETIEDEGKESEDVLFEEV